MIAPVLPVYQRADLAMVRGEGVHLYDAAGKRYLDFATGIAVNSLGHCHPHLVAVLKAQAQQLWHCSNRYRIPGLERLAERFVAHSFADTVFFCNSGAEAVECGLKMIRKRFDAVGQPERYRVITMEGGFHGRTLAALSAGGSEKARAGYGPLLDGFDRAAFNDLASVEAAIGPQTAGILIEPVQGEGGIRPATKEFMQGLRALADRHGLLLFLDEVQTGMGRTGTLFAYEQYGVTPDILTLAKGIGGGFPLAACLATAQAAEGMTPGSHGSTYGANPLAMAVGNAVLDVMLTEGFFMHVRKMGLLLRAELESLARAFPRMIAEVRGMGLMLGLALHVSQRDMVARLRDSGLLTVGAEDNVVRILPPLIIGEGEIAEAMAALRKVCGGWA